MNVSWNEMSLSLSKATDVSHVHFPDKLPNKLERNPMANETYISPISFLKGDNLGHVFSGLAFNYLTSEPKCKPQLQSTQ